MAPAIPEVWYYQVQQHRQLSPSKSRMSFVQDVAKECSGLEPDVAHMESRTLQLEVPYGSHLLALGLRVGACPKYHPGKTAATVTRSNLLSKVGGDWPDEAVEEEEGDRRDRWVSVVWEGFSWARCRSRDGYSEVPDGVVERLEEKRDLGYIEVR